MRSSRFRRVHTRSEISRYVVWTARRRHGTTTETGDRRETIENPPRAERAVAYENIVQRSGGREPPWLRMRLLYSVRIEFEFFRLGQLGQSVVERSSALDTTINSLDPVLCVSLSRGLISNIHNCVIIVFMFMNINDVLVSKNILNINTRIASLS